MTPHIRETKLDHNVNCRRLRVVEMERLTNAQPHILQLRTEALDQTKPHQCVINLSGQWTNTKMRPNTIVHLIGAEFDPATSTFNVTNNNGLLVLDPDELMPCTFVVSSLYCARKSWLNQLFNGWISTNQAMLLGTMVHEVFQYACETKMIDEDKLYQVLLKKLDNFSAIQQCYSIGLDLGTLLKLTKEYIPNISMWLRKYLLIGPLYPLSNDDTQQVKVQEIMDIEETIWATKYGLKGKIDLTGIVKIHDRRSGASHTKTLPLELKTGSQYLASSHVGQVSLYSFMIEDRHGVTDQGLLVYLKNGPELHGIKVNQNHKRDLIILRNKLTEHLQDFTDGPEFKDVMRDCSRCERLLECLLMSKIFKPEMLKSSSAMKSLEQEALGHMSEAHVKFFKYWIEVLAHELIFSQKRARDANTFWTYDSSQAETQGSGLSKLSIRKGDKDSDEGLGSSQPAVLVFERHPKYLESLGALNGENFSRKRVAISIDDDQNRDLTSQNINIAKTTGVIIFGDKTSLKLSVDNSLPQHGPETLFRIDFVESVRKGTQQLTNIVRLMYPIDWRYDHLRQIIIPEDGRQNKLKLALDLGGHISRSSNHLMQGLDFSQKKLVIRAAISDDYYLLDESRLSDPDKILPTLVALLRVILHLNRTVLIVGSSFQASSMLSSLLQQLRLIDQIDLSLLGNNDPDLKHLELANQIASPGEMKQLDSGEPIELQFESSVRSKFDKGFERFDKCKILATTYYNITRSSIFERRHFDYCLMFDCDTTDLPTCLEPMFICDRYIVVDHRTPMPATNQLSLNGNGIDETGKTKKKLLISLGDHLRQLTSSHG